MIIEDKLMRYILYKKRTVSEVRNKCKLLKRISRIDGAEQILNSRSQSIKINIRMKKSTPRHNLIKL